MNDATPLTQSFSRDLRQRYESLRPLFPDERVFRGTVLSLFALSQLCPPGTFATCLAELESLAPPPPPIKLNDELSDDTYVVLPAAKERMQSALQQGGIVQSKPNHHAGDTSLWCRLSGIKTIEIWGKCLKAFVDVPRLSPHTAARCIIRELEHMAATNRKVLGDALPAELAGLLAELGNPQPGETILDGFGECGCVLAEAVLQTPGSCHAVYMKRAPDALPHPDFDAPTMDVALALLALALTPHAATGEAILSSTLSPLFVEQETYALHGFQKEHALSGFQKEHALAGIMAPMPDSADLVVSLLPLAGVYHAEAARAEALRVDAEKGLRFQRAVPPPASIAAAGLTVLVDAMRSSTGRAVLATPLSPLFRSGPEEALRAALLEENLLDAVILLPGNVVYESPMQLAILLFDRRRETGNDRADEDAVLFVDAHTLYSAGKNLNAIQPTHRHEIVQLVRERQNVPGKARLVPRAEVREQGVWMPQRYFAESEDADLETTILLLQDELEIVQADLRRVRGLLAADIA